MFNVSVTSELSENEVKQILTTVSAASEFDGVRPFSEHVEIHLRSGGDRHVIHLIAQDVNKKIVGYGHLDTTDLVAGPSGELVVHPDYRRKGIATQLVFEMKQLVGEKPLRLWSHGDTETAQKFSEKQGFISTRNVIQLRRSLFSPIAASDFPQGYEIEEFNVNTNIDEFIELNKVCFIDLPDQSSWTKKDVELRISENWFSKKGFILLRNSNKKLVGFCWTKIHGQDHKHDVDDGHEHKNHGHNPIGEIYVLGVAPQEQGNGLGKALTLWGLNHLRRQGLDSAMLYVDKSNLKAIELYEDLDFAFWGLDRLYRSLT